MVQVYYEKDASLDVLNNKTIAIIGYGNQGRAQALNMRDCKVKIVVGNIDDEYKQRAQQDALPVLPIAEAVEKADIIVLLLPDEIQKKVYDAEILPRLKPGKTLVFAHGYNLHYGFIDLPKTIDVLLIAPVMIGIAVRELFLKGSGAVARVGVHQDASGRAKETMLGLAKAIGITRVGAIDSTVAEETEIDHFIEQTLWAAIDRIFVMCFEVLTEAGYPPEAVILDLYASGEPAEILQTFATQGLFKQMRNHSRTSQYGTISRGSRIVPESMREEMKRSLYEIRNGIFAKEWQLEQSSGYPVFNKLMEHAMSHPMNRYEEDLRRKLTISV